jgi:hypothetical protein
MEESKMNPIPSNSKIKYPLLSILFIILFILTALQFHHPTAVYATEDDDVSSIKAEVNTTSFSSNETDQAGEDTAGYLYWAASGDRSGIELYLVDDTGHMWWRCMYFDLAGIDMQKDYANTTMYAYAYQKTYAHAGMGGSIKNYTYLPDVSTVYYDNEWKSCGTPVADWLVADADYNGMSATFTLNGIKYTIQNWMNLIIQDVGTAEFKEYITPLIESVDKDVTWHVFYEPVSVDYLYTNNTFGSSGGEDTNGLEYQADSPIPSHHGDMNSDGTGSWTPYVFIADATSFITEYIPTYVSPSGAGDYTWKFYNKQLPFSLCLKKDVEIATGVASGTGKVSTKVLSACKMNIDDITGPSNSLTSSHISDGVGIASIDISIFKQPIHTYHKDEGSPGNSEKTKKDKTDGTCYIYKYYYTVTTTYDDDGNKTKIKVEKGSTFTREKTTNLIDVMDESKISGYKLELWTTSKNQKTAIATENSDFTVSYSFSGGNGNQHGDTEEEITIDTEEAKEDSVNLILVKYVDKSEPKEEKDKFEITESTLTKRVNFSQVTLKLKEATFEWTRNQFDSKAA